MGVGLADTARQRGIRPHLDARFAQGLRPAAADETVGFVQREDHAGEAVAQLSGSLLRREHGSIEE